MSGSEAKAAIRDQALALGFDAVGFARAEIAPAARERLAGFLRAGWHGDMGWMADREEQRGDPRRLWPEARSVVALGLNYGPDENPLAALDRRAQGTLSVYAGHRDYHDVLKKKLRPLARFIAGTFAAEVKLFVDTAPVMEKPLGQAAGIGWQGKHTNLVSRDFGSWLFLAEILTTLDLAPDAPHEDRCGACSRCLDICPTAAFPAPYRLDARRCISYLTIEHKGPIPRALRPLLGNRVYGCDDCLAVCPWNKFAKATRESGLMARDALRGPALAALARLDDGGFRRLFSGSAVKRIGRARFLRNVLVAIGNSGEAKLAAAAVDNLADPSPLVRGAAIWAAARLLPRVAFLALRARLRPAETDAEVAGEWEAD